MNRSPSRARAAAFSSIGSLACGTAGGGLAFLAGEQFFRAVLVGGSAAVTAMTLAVTVLSFLFDDGGCRKQ